MKKINSGKLRAIGYDQGQRILRVELENGTALEYSGVGLDLWRRFSNSGVAWSFYRDNIEEEFPAKRGPARPASSAQRAALDDLFGGGEKKEDGGE
ncbi:KTSC domain-containing protein [Massilia sp. W12]|uniref:KTSC domain-containing protein n=1 Tax=Massilia sp. W12 TaxID=3126507 RepID=UPI0030D1A831